MHTYMKHRNKQKEISKKQKGKDAHDALPLFLFANPSIRARGFTLVETLVAIAVLMIAIAGPLVVASKGLTAALISRDQMTASLLAQETMEMIKNTRDNNVSTGLPWDDRLSWCLRPTINDPLKCDFLPFAPPTANIVINCHFGSSQGCRLYHSLDGYQATVTSEPTLFYRYFYLNQRGAAANNYTATVVVSWYHGTILNEVRLTSELTSGIR